MLYVRMYKNYINIGLVLNRLANNILNSTLDYHYVTCCCSCKYLFKIYLLRELKKQLTLNVQGRTLERKKEAGLKALKTVLSCNIPATSRQIVFSRPTTESSSASAKKIRIQPETEITNETYVISSGYVIFDF